MLWEDKALATGGVHVAVPGGKHFPVRCTTDFEWLLFGQMWARECRCPEVGHALHKLLDRIVPQGAALFRRRYTPEVLFAECNDSATKVFVYAIILLSKWLGNGKHPDGGYARPPPIPAEVSVGR